MKPTIPGWYWIEGELLHHRCGILRGCVQVWSQQLYPPEETLCTNLEGLCGLKETMSVTNAELANMRWGPRLCGLKGP